MRGAVLALGMVLALGISPARAATPTVGSSCQPTEAVPDSLQVAWVSRLEARVGARTSLPVVRVSDLRRLVEANGRDATRVLRALGLVGKRQQARGAWKVTVFDVKRDWLCRPVIGPEDTTIVGVPACSEKQQRGAPGIRASAWTGCGYLLDTATGARTLDVFRIEWENAVPWGFCVLPLRRFLDGA